jgi:hypothetical protein
MELDLNKLGTFGKNKMEFGRASAEVGWEGLRLRGLFW